MGGCASAMCQKCQNMLRIFAKNISPAAKADKSAALLDVNSHSRSATAASAAKVRKAQTQNVEKIELTESVVEEYIQLEKTIHNLERKNVLKKYESKMIFADDVKKNVDQMEATYRELKKQTEKEKSDVENLEQPSVKAFLVQQRTWQQRIDKEQREYIDALNRQEVAEKELNGKKLQYERAAKIADIYKRQCDSLNELYQKQDNMLIGIFGADYASAKENQLEAELDDAVEWQQRISLAKFKWSNGRVLLVHAATQLAFGVSRWRELEQIDPSNTRMRYFAAAEARNNFIAAGQNVQSCRVYLGRVKFPYATEEEMTIMETTIQNSFNDIQSNVGLRKALTVYNNTHRKVVSLIQWFDKVINDTILKDLDKANTNVSKRQKQLREERLELMRRKVRAEFGRELEISHEELAVDDNDDELLALEADQVKENPDLRLPQPQEPPIEKVRRVKSAPKDENSLNSAPLSLNKLAPIPSRASLFGDIRQRLSEYEDARAAIQRRNESMRAKQQMVLQEKLRMRQQIARRTRYQRRKSTILPLDSDTFERATQLHKSVNFVGESSNRPPQPNDVSTASAAKSKLRHGRSNTRKKEDEHRHKRRDEDGENRWRRAVLDVGSRQSTSLEEITEDGIKAKEMLGMSISSDSKIADAVETEFGRNSSNSRSSSSKNSEKTDSENSNSNHSPQLREESVSVGSEESETVNDEYGSDEDVEDEESAREADNNDAINDNTVVESYEKIR